MQIAVVGNDDFVTGFRLAGVERVSVAMEAELEPAVQEMMENPDIGILVMEDASLSHLSHRMRRALDKQVKPVLVTLSLSGEKQDDIRTLIKRSVGIDLLKE